jgi:uncharacterized protein (TIGR02611 family)
MFGVRPETETDRESPPSRGEPHVPALVRRLQERRAQHHEHHVLIRVAWVVAGFVLTTAGLAMLVTPGPAFVVIPAGLAILSLEFAWAARMLDRSLVHAHRAQQRAGAATRRENALAFAAGVALAAAGLVVALRYDVPILPV